MGHKYYLTSHKSCGKSIQRPAEPSVDETPIAPTKIKPTTTNLAPGLKSSKIGPLQTRYAVSFVSKSEG